jgi:gliding-associated putative ABC transporter substrate-binding component GldG
MKHLIALLLGKDSIDGAGNARPADPVRTRRLQRRLIASLVVLDVLLAFLVSARFFLRADLTRNRVYTLSRTSREIVAGLPEQLSLTYYVSDTLRGRSLFPRQVSDVLDEYAIWSRGRVSVASVDPAKGGAAASMESLGVAAKQMQVVDRDQVNLATVYSGIVLRYLDRTATLPFVSDISTLEYDLSSQIRSLVAGRSRAVGVILGDGRQSLGKNYTYMQQELSSQFTLRQVPLGDEIPADITTLLVIGTRDIDEPTAFRVDQFIMRGGRVLFAVDPVAVDLASGLKAAATPSTAVEDALGCYGVRVRPQIVMDVLNQKISFNVQQGRYMIVNYPQWVTVSGRNVDAAHPITARFAGLDLYWPCPLETITRQDVTARVLARTSADAWVMKESFETNPLIVQTMKGQSGETGQYILALALSGGFRSAYADRPVPTRPGEGQAQAPLTACTAPTRLIVVGNAGFASDIIQYTQASYNLTFLSNCVEWLSQEDDLLAIKTRAQADTRLNGIADPTRKAAAMRRAIALNVVIVPLCVIGVGAFRLLRRRRGKHQQPGDAA